MQEAGGGRLTETGLSVGTPYYMSPEQATGDRDPDARADLYSLASVLYEMLTGEPPFQGSTAQAVLGRILTGEAEAPTRVRKSIPANVEAAVLTALAKVPADRFPNAGEFTRALTDPGYRRSVGSDPGVVRARRIPRLAWAAGSVALAVAAFLVGRGAPVESASSGTEILAELGVQASPGSLLLTPTGGVAFRGLERSDAPSLLYRPPESSRVADLGDFTGRWAASPDGSVLVMGGFEGGLSRIPVDGREVVELLPPPDSDGGVPKFRFPEFWEEGEITLLTREGWGMQRVVRLDEETRTSEEILDATDWPFAIGGVAPGPDGLLFVTAHSVSVTYVADTTRILAVRPESGDTVLAVAEGTEPHWVDTGHIVYLAPDGEIMALPWDPATLRPTAPPFRLGLSTEAWFTFRLIDVSGDRLAFTRNTVVDGGAIQRFSWVDPDSGDRQALRLPDRAYNYSRLSPDGQRLLLREAVGLVPQRVEELSTGRRFDIEGAEAAGDGAGSRAGFGAWSPDSEALAWLVGGRLVIAEGPGLGERTSYELDLPTSLRTSSASLIAWPDDDLIVVRTIATMEAGAPVVRIRRVGDGWETEEANRPWQEVVRAVSPDGRWAAVRESFPGSTGAELWIRPWPSLEGGSLVLATDSADVAWGQASWTKAGGTFVHAIADTVVVSDFAESSGEPRVSERSRVVVGGRWQQDQWLKVAPDGRILELAPPDADLRLPPHEQNRVMLLTGLRERLRRMDPATAAGGAR